MDELDNVIDGTVADGLDESFLETTIMENNANSEVVNNVVNIRTVPIESNAKIFIKTANHDPIKKKTTPKLALNNIVIENKNLLRFIQQNKTKQLTKRNKNIVYMYQPNASSQVASKLIKPVFTPVVTTTNANLQNRLIISTEGTKNLSTKNPNFSEKLINIITVNNSKNQTNVSAPILGQPVVRVIKKSNSSQRPILVSNPQKLIRQSDGTLHLVTNESFKQLILTPNKVKRSTRPNIVLKQQISKDSSISIANKIVNNSLLIKKDGTVPNRDESVKKSSQILTVKRCNNSTSPVVKKFISSSSEKIFNFEGILDNKFQKLTNNDNQLKIHNINKLQSKLTVGQVVDFKNREAASVTHPGTVVKQLIFDKKNATIYSKKSSETTTSNDKQTYVFKANYSNGALTDIQHNLLVAAIAKTPPKNIKTDEIPSSSSNDLPPLNGSSGKVLQINSRTNKISLVHLLKKYSNKEKKKSNKAEETTNKEKRLSRKRASSNNSDDGNDDEQNKKSKKIRDYVDYPYQTISETSDDAVNENDDIAKDSKVRTALQNEEIMEEKKKNEEVMDLVEKNLNKALNELTEVTERLSSPSLKDESENYLTPLKIPKLKMLNFKINKMKNLIFQDFEKLLKMPKFVNFQSSLEQYLLLLKNIKQSDDIPLLESLSGTDNVDPLKVIKWNRRLGSVGSPEKKINFRVNKCGMLVLSEMKSTNDNSASLTCAECKKIEKVTLCYSKTYCTYRCMISAKKKNTINNKKNIFKKTLNEKNKSSNVKSSPKSSEFSATQNSAGNDFSNKDYTQLKKYKPKNGTFNWFEYLRNSKTLPAWFNYFTYVFPTFENKFKVGERLEAIDPDNQSYVCPVVVAEIRGCRLKLHFDNYSDHYDFWQNIYSPNIFPCGFAEKMKLKFLTPKRYVNKNFSWKKYLNEIDAKAAPVNNFQIRQIFSQNKNKFNIGMKLEALDRKGIKKMGVATVAAILGNRILIHFDNCNEKYDYWTEIDSPLIFPPGWCRRNKIQLVPPPGYTQYNFSWNNYLEKSKTVPTPNSIFEKRSPKKFKAGMKLEAIDIYQPELMRVATVRQTANYQLQIHYDGYPSNLSFWVDDDFPEIHPITWCWRTNHPLEVPSNIGYLAQVNKNTNKILHNLSSDHAKLTPEYPILKKNCSLGNRLKVKNDEIKQEVKRNKNYIMENINFASMYWQNDYEDSFDCNSDFFPLKENTEDFITMNLYLSALNCLKKDITTLPTWTDDDVTNFFYECQVYDSNIDDYQKLNGISILTVRFEELLKYFSLNTAIRMIHVIRFLRRKYFLTAKFSSNI